MALISGLVFGGLAAFAPAGALASGTTSCSQSALQGALNGAVPGTPLTITMPANCYIQLGSSLRVGPGVDITIDGNGLVLDGGGTFSNGVYVSFLQEVILIDDASAASTVTFNHVEIEGATNAGIGDTSVGVNGYPNSTVNLEDSHIKYSDIAVSAGIVNVTISEIDCEYLGVAATTVTVTGSVIGGCSGTAVSASDATVTGSAIFLNSGYGVNASGDVAVTDSTIGYNSEGAVAGSNAIVTDSTIVGNNGGATTTIRANTATLTANIITTNGCVIGSLSDGGYNYATDSSCVNGGTGSKVVDGATLDLKTASGYGGPSLVFPFSPGSIAIDAIPTSFCSTIKDPSGNVITTDQRGVSRPQGNGCDVGAYEAPSIKLSVSPSSPEGADGWYTSTPVVTLTYGGLAVGLKPQTAQCGPSTLSYTATGLNQSGTVQIAAADGTYSIICAVTADNYGSLGFSYSGPTLPLGLNVDTVKPSVTITTPANDANYVPGTAINADYSCDDATSGVASCAGTVANDSAIDMSTGSHTFEVTATDKAGNTTTKTVSYDVGIAAPTLSINGAAPNTSTSFWYNRSSGAMLSLSDTDSGVTSYSCTVNGQPLALTNGSETLPDGADLISCTASAGDITSTATTATVQVDTVSPTINSPADGATVILGQSLALGCADPPGANVSAVSGVASCAAMVTLPDDSIQTVNQGQSVPTGQVGNYTVKSNTVTDTAGNADTSSSSYTVEYQLTSMPGSSQSVRHGYIALFRLAPQDAQGHDLASRQMVAKSVELDGPSGQVIAFVHQFQFMQAHGVPQYQLEVNTRNLAPGNWTLKLTIGTSPIVYNVEFSVTR